MNEKYTKKIFSITIVYIAIIYIVLPVILYFLIDKFNFMSSKLSADNWLMFWATYLAGTLGGFATLVAMLYTVNNSNALQKKEHKKRDKEIAEDRKYQYFPYLSVQKLTEAKYTEFSKKENKEEIYRYVYLPEASIQNILCQEKNERTMYLKIKNTGLGPATNIYLLYDNRYVINGTNLKKVTNSLEVTECLNLSKDETILCKITFNISMDLIKKQSSLNSALFIDFLYQDMSENLIRKRICFSLKNEDTYKFSEYAPEYLSLENIKKQYKHIQGVDRLFSKNPSTIQ